MKGFLFALLAVASLPAFATEDGGHPCRDDRLKFCKDVKPGGGAIGRCMKEHEAELSAECKAKMSAMKEKRVAMREACKEDWQKFCKENKEGKGGPREKLSCLKEHESELSQACKAALPERRK